MQSLGTSRNSDRAMVLHQSQLISHASPVSQEGGESRIFARRDTKKNLHVFDSTKSGHCEARWGVLCSAATLRPQFPRKQTPKS